MPLAKERPHVITPEELDWLSEQTNRAAKAAVRTWALRATIGLICAVLGAGWALYTVAEESAHKDRQIITRLERIVHRQNAAIYGGCKRLNGVRAQSNVSDSVSFNVLSASIKQDMQHTGAARFARDAERLSVTPLTNCNLAVLHPLTYNAPIPGPLGNATTGRLNSGVEHVVTQSEAIIQERHARR